MLQYPIASSSAVVALSVLRGAAVALFSCISPTAAPTPLFPRTMSEAKPAAAEKPQRSLEVECGKY